MTADFRSETENVSVMLDIYREVACNLYDPSCLSPERCELFLSDLTAALAERLNDALVSEVRQYLISRNQRVAISPFLDAARIGDRVRKAIATQRRSEAVEISPEEIEGAEVALGLNAATRSLCWSDFANLAAAWERS